jgi:hypothetical protein
VALEPVLQTQLVLVVAAAVVGLVLPVLELQIKVLGGQQALTLVAVVVELVSPV